MSVKLTPAGLVMLRNAVAGLPLKDGPVGMSASGGAERTRAKLQRDGYLDAGGKATELGRTAAAALGKGKS